MKSSQLKFTPRKVKARVLSPSERRALAPTPPKGAQLRYLALTAAWSKRVRELVFKRLRPLMPDFDPFFEASKQPTGIRQDCTSDWFEVTLAMDAPRMDDADLDGPYEDAFGALQAELDALSEGFEVPLTAIGRDVVRHNLAESEKVLGTTPGGREAFDRQVREFVRRNVGLIKTVEAEHLERVRELVTGADAHTLRVETLQGQLQAEFAMPAARANLIARDQVLKLNNQITQSRQLSAGITEYVWTTARDERVRGRPGGVWANSQSDHWALDGKTFRWDQPPVTNPVTGERNHPGQDIQCRCVAVPVVDRLLGGEVVRVAP